MNAEEARRLTNAAIDGKCTESYLPLIFKHIRSVVDSGQFSTRWDAIDWGENAHGPTSGQVERLEQRLQAAGYEIEEVPAKPGDPRAHGYTKISW